MTQTQRGQKHRAERLLRLVKDGDAVTGTKSSPHAGTKGIVTEAHPFSPDGISRVRVNWEDGSTVLCLPTSISLDRLEDH
jgi:hypothetical protein